MTTLDPTVGSRGPNGPHDRRVQRLRDELIDESVPLPVDGPGGRALLGELTYARRPEVHERRVPRYGSLVLATPLDDHEAVHGPLDVGPGGEVIRARPRDTAAARRAADGRASLLVVDPTGVCGAAVFDRAIDFEATAVDLRTHANAVVVQRTAMNTVRACTPDGVVSWDGVRWTFKPGASRVIPQVTRLRPDADPVVLEALMDLAVHWLSAGYAGSTLVWRVSDRAVTSLERATPDDAATDPDDPPLPLQLTDMRTRGAWLSLLSQTDGAAVIGPAGHLEHLGVTLHPSPEALSLIPPIGGTRHTSARRWSHDNPEAIVVVVSEDGPVSVFADGGPAARVRTDPCQTGFSADLLPSDPDPAGEAVRTCPGCAKNLLIDEVRFAGWDGGPESGSCPACGLAVEMDVYRAAIRGVVPAARESHGLLRPASD